MLKLSDGDHRKLGVELDLFSFPDELAQASLCSTPRVASSARQWRTTPVNATSTQVTSSSTPPHITKGHLYEVSGHLDWYKDGMFPAMQVDAEFNEDGTVRKPAQDYYLKPMNCPHAQPDLPLTGAGPTANFRCASSNSALCTATKSPGGLCTV